MAFALFGLREFGLIFFFLGGFFLLGGKVFGKGLLFLLELGLLFLFLLDFECFLLGLLFIDLGLLPEGLIAEAFEEFEDIFLGIGEVVFESFVFCVIG